MQKVLISAVTLMSVGISASSAESPLWLRNAAVSPDGKVIAFTYKGDIFTVPSEGGEARQLTSSSEFDSYPIWSPDGTKIVFGSDREGSMDLYVIDSKGGKPSRITTHSGTETPRAFIDDTHILYSSSGQPDRDFSQGSFLGQTYVVDINGGRPSLFISIPMSSVSVKGNNILYQDKKSFEDVLRKHETSSGTSDIWLLSFDGSDVKKGTFRQLTRFNGQDQNPVWNGASDTFYYLSEEDGNSNIYQANTDGSGKKQLTKFKDNPVRHLSASSDGRKLAFSQNGELYTLVPGSEPVKVNVGITYDDYTRDVIKSLNHSGATDFSVNNDGTEVAFVMRGDVYVTSVKYSTTKRITDTPEQERVVDFAPDGKTLVYDSERDGMWQLFTAKIKNPDEKNFTYATEIVEEPLYKTDVPSFQPSFSPDGKKVAFLENRTTLRVIDLDTKKVNTALDGKYNYSYTDGDVSYAWSPDSRWFLTDYIGTGGWNNKDIALVSADGSKVVDLTNSGYSDQNAKWVLDGKAMTWESDRNGYRSHGSWGAESDVFIMFFDSDAYDRFRMTEEEAELLDKKDEDKDKDKESDDKDSKKKNKKDKKGKDVDKKEEVKPLELDIENAKYRVARLTRNSSNLGDHYLDKKGEKLYYIASFENEGDLWSVDLKKGDVSIVSKGIGYGAFDNDKSGDVIYICGNGLKKVTVPGGEVKSIDFNAPFNYKPFAERQYMYDHMWQQVKDKFYDENLHGVDWEKYRAEYQKFLPHINNNYDFAELLSEILGELNASHTGGRYYAPGATWNTPYLGAFFDENYTGDGLKVAEVLKRGPLDSKRANVAVGDIIIAIDGDTVSAGKDYFPMLEGKGGKNVRLTVKKANGKVEEISVKPISAGENSSLLYSRWVERNRHIVDSVSGGKVGYVHVKGMDSPSYRKVYEDMLGLHRNCDAIIVDTRYNGGGWLHNDLAILLNGKEYSRFTPRGQYIGSEPFSQWYKPSVMLVNEANYSDGYGAPYAYQTLKLGEIVGAPIPGTMTAVWWENQVDPSIIFGIPQVTNADVNGVALENKQLNPDVVIYNTPSEIINGGDSQLVGAVKHLLDKISKNKK